ncbi:MAG: tryptophan 2,3-dioxygenase family protein [Bacteroidia bacterium]|nr:tryptophan 2,3-dioxygenase family protein [Bacteroidia bacterium]
MSQRDWKEQMPQITERLTQLEEKYAGLGQDMLSYLEGLYYSNGLTYWDYIHLDSLLGLQVPRTPFQDEVIFIAYHQITELYFKLVKLELERLTLDQGEASEYLQAADWLKRIGRATHYFELLCDSFDIMLSGMDPVELRKFRMALLPASGFQSVQFRHIEIMSTSLDNLSRPAPQTAEDESTPIEDLYAHIYWKQGGIDLETGRKTLTLREFEAKYDDSLIQMLYKYQTRNLYYLFSQAPERVRQDPAVHEALRAYDQIVNVFWKLSHLSAAARHLVSGGQDIEATGGTNWRTFLPPKFQRIVFFPSRWSDEELEDWGKSAVIRQFQSRIAGEWRK